MTQQRHDRGRTLFAGFGTADGRFIIATKLIHAVRSSLQFPQRHIPPVLFTAPFLKEESMSLLHSLGF